MMEFLLIQSNIHVRHVTLPQTLRKRELHALGLPPLLVFVFSYQSSSLLLFWVTFDSFFHSVHISCRLKPWLSIYWKMQSSFTELYFCLAFFQVPHTVVQKKIYPMVMMHEEQQGHDP